MMTERKENRRYVFTVEGECEARYLKYLQNLINSTEESAFTVEIKPFVTSDPYKTAKAFNCITTPQLYHLCDVESQEHEHVIKFQKILKELSTIKKEKKFQYDLGYSNFTFELWMILHKSICNGCLTHRKDYLPFINRAYHMNFSTLKEYKEENNFQKCLEQLNLSDIKDAIARAKTIMKQRQEDDVLVRTCGYQYYKKNPSLNIWNGIETILKDCALI